MSSKLIHHGFEERGAAMPSAVAVACGRSSLTYAQLNDRANYLAHRLTAHGVGKQDIVAVWGTQSIDTLVSLLAVVKVGGAFLPLDPAYPFDRLAFMLADTGAKHLLASVQCGEAPTFRNVAAIDSSIATHEGTTEPGRSTNPPSSADSHDLAYVIYTSGSTGRPKGVMIEHAAVVNTLDDINDRFEVGLHDRLLCLSSFAFDLSVYDVFGVLGAGGTIVLPADAEARDPAAWAKLIVQHGVTIWNTVPSLMEMMVTYAETADRDALRPLRLALLSGDWIPVSLPDRVRMLHPATQVVSLGGATEASIWSIYYPIDQVDPAWTSIPYGRPLCNQTVYVLDDHLRPCSVGTPGELYIGGAGVARGYFNRPELTNYRFVLDPFASDCVARLYRTGDMGRYRPDGDIEFLGRIDNQVKINGHRIELGEIETALARHPSVREAVVVAPYDKGRRRRLLACYVPTHEGAPTNADLQQFLAASLPSYMVPTRFAALNEMPLSANGKVDRCALATNPRFVRVETEEFAAPRNDIERRLADIWASAFDQPTVGVNDNFFALGGDSLLAVSILAHVEREFHASLTLNDLVQHPTISDLAIILQPGSDLREIPRAVEIQSGGTLPPLFCAPGILGCLIEFRALAAYLDVDQPVFGLEPLGVDGRHDPHDTIEQIADHCLQQVRGVQTRGPYYLAGYSLGGVIAYEMAQRLTADGEQVRMLLLVDAPLRAKRPIVRVCEHLVKKTASQVAAAWRRIRGGEPLAPEVETLNPRLFAVHHKALRRYVARPYDGPTVIIRPADDTSGLKHAIDGWTREWKHYGLVDPRTPIIYTPGDHRSMFTLPNVKTLAERIQDILDDTMTVPDDVPAMRQLLGVTDTAR